MVQQLRRCMLLRLPPKKWVSLAFIDNAVLVASPGSVGTSIISFAAGSLTLMSTSSADALPFSEAVTLNICGCRC